MDKNIALILALLLTPSTIFMFCIHYSSPVPRAPFPTSRSPYPVYQTFPIELLGERWRDSKGNEIDLFGLFCFPSTGHVIIFWRTVSFKFIRLIHVHMYA